MALQFINRSEAGGRQSRDEDRLARSHAAKVTRKRRRLAENRAIRLLNAVDTRQQQSRTILLDAQPAPSLGRRALHGQSRLTEDGTLHAQANQHSQLSGVEELFDDLEDHGESHARILEAGMDDFTTAARGHRPSKGTGGFCAARLETECWSPTFAYQGSCPLRLVSTLFDGVDVPFPPDSPDAKHLHYCKRRKTSLQRCPVMKRY